MAALLAIAGTTLFSGVVRAQADTGIFSDEEAAPSRASRFNILLPDNSGVAPSDAPVSGRVYVFLATRKSGKLINGPNWFRPDPFLGLNVAGVQPGDGIEIGDTADGYPARLSELPEGEYYAQAILDHNLDSQHHARGAGNHYSQVVHIQLDHTADAAVDLSLTESVEPAEFPDHPRLEEIVLPSPLLSAFHERPVLHRATVVLPASYADQPERRFPTIYIIPGFGGSYRSAQRYLDDDARPDERSDPSAPAADDSNHVAGESVNVEFIRVVLDAQCEWGHHVFADSATNGPRGQALLEELIPHTDATVRTMATPSARFLRGHSSGGWSSLWLMVNFPDSFGGVWSTAPDPVDFRDYQGVDLYADPPLSLYFDEHGERRPIARRRGEPVLWYEDFGRMDDVIARGGQLRSFEAVFSPLGDDGLPLQLWDRIDGRIDPTVASAWRDYDIRLVIQRNWDQLAEKLAGKIHIITGSLDTFYLNGAVERLAESLSELGSDAQIEIVDGADHGSVLRSEPAQRIRAEMVECLLKTHPAGR